MSTSSSIAPPAPRLSEVERVVDTFIAPSKTFADILRNASWWLPFVLISVLGIAQAFVVDRQVGYDRVSENQMHASPKTEDRLNQLTPEQRASQMAISAKITRITSYGIPVLLMVIYSLYTLLLWGSFNFGLGAQTSFAQVFAVSWYSLLPYIATSLLVILTLVFGNNAEGFDIRNPVGTNLAFYLPDAAPWLKSFLTQIDIVRLWSLALQVIGMAIVAKKSITQSAMIVVSFWVLTLLLSTGAAAAFS